LKILLSKAKSNFVFQIFSKYQEVWQELNGVKCENMKLNGYIREILQVRYYNYYKVCGAKVLSDVVLITDLIKFT